MNLYVVFNNPYSGIIQGQVIDRLRFVEREFGVKYALVVFIPMKGYWKSRIKYRSKYKPSWVFPMIGGMRYWWLVLPFMMLATLFDRPQKIIGRASFSTQLAIWMRKIGFVKFVVYDGRGAEAAEWEEYLGNAGWPLPLSRIKKIERNAVIESDQQMAVSNKLVEYWAERYNYPRQESAIVIPCLMNEAFESLEITEDAIAKSRKSLGFENEDIVLLFSASQSDWQRIDDLVDWLVNIMDSNDNIRILALTKQPLPDKLSRKYGNRIIQRWVSPELVPNFYLAADYGLLIRENTITNKVASPVKFAEFLATGLKLIISEQVGDYSDFVKQNGIGILLQFPNDGTYSFNINRNKKKIRQHSLPAISNQGYIAELFQVFG